MTDSAQIVTTELDHLITRHRRELDGVTGELDETQRHHEHLVGRRDYLQATLDALTEFREKVAPTPTAETRRPTAEPLDVRCRACGSSPGQDCIGLDWGTFHAPRMTDASNTAKPDEPESGGVAVGVLSVPCPTCQAAVGQLCRVLDANNYTERPPHLERVAAFHRKRA